MLQSKYLNVQKGFMSLVLGLLIAVVCIVNLAQLLVHFVMSHIYPDNVIESHNLEEIFSLTGVHYDESKGDAYNSSVDAMLGYIGTIEYKFNSFTLYNDMPDIEGLKVALNKRDLSEYGFSNPKIAALNFTLKNVDATAAPSTVEHFGQEYTDVSAYSLKDSDQKTNTLSPFLTSALYVTSSRPLVFVQQKVDTTGWVWAKAGESITLTSYYIVDGNVAKNDNYILDMTPFGSRDRDVHVLLGTPKFEK